MSKNKPKEKTCVKHDWQASWFFTEKITEGMRCRKCSVTREFTPYERNIYELGRKHGRTQTLNKIQDRFSTIVSVELREER